MGNSEEDADMRYLTRSKSNRMIAGVCGGIAEFDGFDPALVRLCFIVLAILCGGGLMVYIMAAIIMPEEGFL